MNGSRSLKTLQKGGAGVDEGTKWGEEKRRAVGIRGRGFRDTKGRR